MTWVLEHQRELIPVRAERAGRVDEGHPVPDAVPVTARRTGGAPPGPPRAWFVGADGEPGAWRRHARGFDRTGLWPLLSCSPEHLLLDDAQPADATPSDVSDVLAGSWEGTRLVDPDGTLRPHPPWPGLATPSGVPVGAVALPDLPWGRGDLLLVPATRPADAVARLGWFGAVNWSLLAADVAGVLRSWEDRFGAYVVAVGPAELDLVVTRPPRTADQCRVLTDEHYAFCPDNFFPQTLPEQDAIPPERYARDLRGALTWHFWWD